MPRREHRTGDASFSTTQWSLVVAAAEEDRTDARTALAELCERYWYPIYAHLRRMRHAPERAEDLTQSFFAHLLEKKIIKVARPERGRFRAFLKVSLKHFISNELHRARAQKRGGGRQLLSLDFSGAESTYRLEPGHDRTPEALFERNWARMLLSRALERLRAELEDPAARQRLRRLEPFLTDQPSDLNYRQVASELKMSVSGVKVAVHRLRRRFGDALRAEVALTVDCPQTIDEEIRFLLSAVGSRSSRL